MPWIYLVLAVVVLVVGLLVLFLNRRRSRAVGESPVAAPAEPPTGIPISPQPAVAVDEPAVETPPVAVIEVERPSFRARMSKARAALAGTLLGIRGRSGITDETWDDLEEALLRADVGVRVTDDLLDGLRVKVKGKEITEPDQLLDGLR